MTCLEWSRKLDELREGRLRLRAPEENGLSREAGRSFFDLQEYVKALEHGYRRVCEDLDLYRKRERVRGGLRFEGKTVEELLENQRSVEACLGYALMALQQERHNDIWPVLDRMRQEMEARIWMPWEAEQVYRRYAFESAEGGAAAQSGRPMTAPTEGGRQVDSPTGAEEGGAAAQSGRPMTAPTEGGRSGIVPFMGIDGPTGAEEGANGGPEWVGPSAELKTEAPG